MSGIGNRCFSPDTVLTRGMFVTMLARLAGVNQADYPDSRFADVAASAWYAPSVSWAASEGIVSGVGDGKFEPNRNITRQEMAKVLYGYDKIGGKTAEGITEKLTYTDLDAIADWALEAVTYCTAEKYLAGSNGAFSPKGTATRAMGAKVLMNMTKDAA